MSERVFRELPPVKAELVEALKKLHDENEQLTGAYIRPEHVVVDTTGLKFENLERAPIIEDYCRQCGRHLGEGDPADTCSDCLDQSNPSAHLGHHYGPVHPNIMPYTPVEKERS